MVFRAVAILAGLIALFSVVSCGGANDATQTAEAPMKEAESVASEAEQALEQKRKDAGLMSCEDLEDAAVLRASLTLNTFGEIEGLDNHRLISVVVDGETPSVTCSAKANLDNDFDGHMFIRYVGEWREGILSVSVANDTRRSSEEATKEAQK